LLERVLQALPDDSRFLGAMGLVLLTEDRKDEAFAWFKKALDNRFDNEAVLFHLVQTALELGRPEEAEPYVRHFAEFYPGNMNAGYQHAAVLFKLGRLDAARDRLETMLLLSPDYAPARELLDSIQGHSHEAGR